MSISRRFGPVAVLILLIIGSQMPKAQTPTTNPLTLATSLKCVFSVRAGGAWTNGEPRAELKSPELSIEFDSIDAQEGTARVTGPVGSAHITARLSTWSLHLIEISTTGTLKITTVFSQESRAGKLKAVHSGHNYFPISIPGFASEPEVAQYYGECEVRR